MNLSFRHKTWVKFGSWLLCLLFIAQIANRAIYFHSHILGNGTIISHAHPYQKSSDSTPYKKHHHSDYQLLFLQQLDVLFNFAFATFAFYQICKRFDYPGKTNNKYISGYLTHRLGRGPPVCL